MEKMQNSYSGKDGFGLRSMPKAVPGVFSVISRGISFMLFFSLGMNSRVTTPRSAR